MHSHMNTSNIYQNRNVQVLISPPKYNESKIIEQLRLQNEFLKSQINYIITKQAYQQSISNNGYRESENIVPSPRSNLEQQMNISQIYQNPVNKLVFIEPTNTLSRANGTNLTSRQSQMPKNNYKSPRIVMNNRQNSALSYQEDQSSFYGHYNGEKPIKSMHRREMSDVVQFSTRRYTQLKKYTPRQCPLRQSNFFDVIKQEKHSGFYRSPQINPFKKRQVKSPTFLKKKNKYDQHKENMQLIRNFSKQLQLSKEKGQTKSSSANKQHVNCFIQKSLNNEKYMKEQLVCQKKKYRVPSITLEQESQTEIQRQLRFVMQM